jgi:hypothetical protein
MRGMDKRVLGFQGPAQPSPALGDALNAGYLYLEVKCLGCSTHQTIALNITWRAKATPIHESERYMRCNDCSRFEGRPYKRSDLVALRTTKISASDPPSTWWPGEVSTTRFEEMMVQFADTDPLVGTWKLVSFQVETEGSKELQPWWDEHPVGFVVFTGMGKCFPC